MIPKLKKNDEYVFVKLSSAGCLPYHEDPKGFRSLTAQVLTKDTSFHWSLTASSELLSSFSRWFHDFFSCFCFLHFVWFHNFFFYFGYYYSVLSDFTIFFFRFPVNQESAVFPGLLLKVILKVNMTINMKMLWVRCYTNVQVMKS